MNLFKSGKILIKLLFVVMAGITYMSTACNNIQKPLTADELEMIDTLVNKRLVLLEHEMDSICNLNYERLVSDAIDSILEVRIEENKTLMNGIKE